MSTGKGHMRIQFVINRGNYNSLRVEVEEPYELSEWTLEQKFDDLMDRLSAKLRERELLK